jgi:polyisoprenoid-binding protein YceI
MRRALLCATALLSLPVAAEVETFTIDSRHTFPMYEVLHSGYSLQRGRFNKTAGKITMDSAAKTGSADIVIDATSVSTGIEKLEEHIRSDDFLKSAANPNITFKSNQFVYEGDVLKRAVGDLTIAGVTRPVTLDIRRLHCAPHPVNKRKVCGADLSTQIKRSDFGIKYGLPGLADDMTLHIAVEAIKDS